MTSPQSGPDTTGEPQTDDPHAGLSATGRTADQMHVDDAKPGTDYGAPAAIGEDDEESAGG